MAIEIDKKTKLSDILAQLQEIFGFDITNKAGTGCIILQLK